VGGWGDNSMLGGINVMITRYHPSREFKLNNKVYSSPVIFVRSINGGVIEYIFMCVIDHEGHSTSAGHYKYHAKICMVLRGYLFYIYLTCCASLVISVVRCIILAERLVEGDSWLRDRGTSLGDIKQFLFRHGLTTTGNKVTLCVCMCVYVCVCVATSDLFST
jgi:hypothetical protein